MKLIDPFDLSRGALPEAPKFNYRPVGWFLQVVSVEAGLMTKGGIVLPGTGNLNFMTCRVVAVGPECKMCKVGDMVLLAKEGLVRAPHNGDNPMFIEERRVISIVELVAPEAAEQWAEVNSMIENFPLPEGREGQPSIDVPPQPKPNGS